MDSSPCPLQRGISDGVLPLPPPKGDNRGTISNCPPLEGAGGGNKYITKL